MSRLLGRVSVRRAVALSVTALVLVGCKSSSSRQEQSPAPPPEDASPLVSPQEDVGVERSVDALNRPIDPRTGEAYDTVFYFDYDKSVLRPEALAALEGHAAYLRSAPEVRVVIEGHGDERGTREYNLALGERRGDAVRTFLASSGVSRSQMDVVSYGEERPVDPGHDEAAWAKNRRAELSYR